MDANRALEVLDIIAKRQALVWEDRMAHIEAVKVLSFAIQKEVESNATTNGSGADPNDI